MSDKNWRTPITGFDYFQGQKKTSEVADRRPVIRQASDLVGPGISAAAVRISDYNDLLATFNGYYSSAAGAASAPNEDEAFVGFVISDAELGGRQVFTGLVSGNEYSRTFTRSPTDPETLGWGEWSGQRVPPTATGQERVATYCPAGAITVLEPPTIETIGEGEVYENSTGGIRVRKQGVYTGHIQVGDYTGTAVADIYVTLPMGDETQMVGQLGQSLAPTIYIPFTVIARNADQGFGVTAVLSGATSLELWWRFACTRVGDAV